MIKSFFYFSIVTLLCSMYAYVMASIISIAVNNFITAIFYEAIK